MSEDISLGKLITTQRGRDAVHVAVIPVTAAQTLMPGSHVGLWEDGRVGDSENPVGIIDPFLKEAVRQGQRCWLFLYPGTITGLRHVWQHPAFSPQPPKVVQDE